MTSINPTALTVIYAVLLPLTLFFSCVTIWSLMIKQMKDENIGLEEWAHKYPKNAIWVTLICFCLILILFAG